MHLSSVRAVYHKEKWSFFCLIFKLQNSSQLGLHCFRKNFTYKKAFLATMDIDRQMDTLLSIYLSIYMDIGIQEIVNLLVDTMRTVPAVYLPCIHVTILLQTLKKDSHTIRNSCSKSPFRGSTEKRSLHFVCERFKQNNQSNRKQDKNYNKIQAKKRKAL